MAKRINRFHMERLEDRQMMAGDVTASLVNGTLFINEAPGNLGTPQAIQVHQAPTGHVVVMTRTSLDNPVGSKVNGSDLVVFSHPNDIVIGLGGGNDFLHVIGTNVRNIQILTGDPSGGSLDADSVIVENVRTLGAVDIRTGNGLDRVRVLNSTIGDGSGFDDLLISTGIAGASLADRDDLLIRGVTTRAATVINTGASNDIVMIQDSNLGNDVNDFLTVKTGAGSDVVEIAPPAGQSGNFQSVGGNIVITTLESEFEADNDRVRMQQLFFESARVQLGGGDDRVDMLGVFGNHTIQLEGMNGVDTMTLREVEARENFFALMGEQDDVLDLTFVKAKAMTLDGGGGFDRLTKSLMPFIPSLTQRNWEVINGILQRVNLAFVDPGLVFTAR